ncbi:MAG: 3-deoxy-manno-octulosonate cytidylyltransferase [Pseudomonadota bacterium]
MSAAAPRVWIAVPARYQSSRFPGKPLTMLRGAGGAQKTLIQRAWEAAIAVPGVERVLVATDDTRIEQAAQAFGAEVAMTPESCANGTERAAAVLNDAGAPPDIIVNLQGDAPLTPPAFVTALIEAMTADREIAVATPVLALDPEAIARFRSDRSQGRVGGTTAVLDAAGGALYFSKEVLPYGADGVAVPAWHHVGVYAYRSDALRAYATLPVGLLEKAEGLEQLRFLENGFALQCVPVERGDGAFWEVNNPGDVAIVEAALAARGLA